MVYENFFSPENCDRLVYMFDRAKELGFVSDRRTSENMASYKKDDEALFAQSLIENFQIDIRSLGDYKLFVETFWKKAYPEYINKYSIIQEATEHKLDKIKIQKTEVGGGYHMWHCEDHHHEHMDRVLTWILYLNDVEEGGETEFLYYPKRIKPKKGTFIMWPAGFTHTHRGNPPISNSKYIATGWVDLVN